MKKMQTVFFVIAVVSVFVLSFLIGRATALRRHEEERSGNDSIYTGTVPLPERKEDSAEDAAASAKANVKKEREEDMPSAEKQGGQPPVKMEFPCGTEVSKQYSEGAVYSETMDDWRAHPGIDYKAESGTQVSAAWEGVVSKVYKDRLWGSCVEIEHSGDVRTVYRNLSDKVFVKENQRVAAGQAIGTVGKTAAVESREQPHLHFEIFQGGIRINPETYVFE